NALHVRRGTQRGDRAAHVPNPLAIQRLADQGEAAASVGVGRSASLRPARRSETARGNRRESPLVMFQRLAVLRELGLVQSRRARQLQRIFEGWPQLLSPLPPTGFIHAS